MSVAFTICRSGFAPLLIAAALVCGSAASAQTDMPSPQPWPVKGKLLGAQSEKAEDVSGIACFPTAIDAPRKCLLVDDESQGVQVVVVKNGEMIAGDFIPLINDSYDSEPLELDAEAVTYADGYFYVAGSHGHPRDKDNELNPITDAAKIAASIKANSHLFRLKIDPASITDSGNLTTAPEKNDSIGLTKFFSDNERLKPFVGKRLDENGLTIEGIAVRDGRLYVGLRGPFLADKKRAAILSVPLNALFDGATQAAELHELELEDGRGVRDLIAYDGKFLVLAGPTAEIEVGLYAIYLWDGSTSRKLYELPKFTRKKGKQNKPEAILPLDLNAGKLRVLVLFDGPKEGAPRDFTFPYP